MSFVRILVAMVLVVASGGAVADHVPRKSLIVPPMVDRSFILKPSASPVLFELVVDQRIEPSARRYVGPDTLALLLVEDGKMRYEYYADDIGPQVALYALSMNKTLVALAVGEALCAGKVKSLDDPAEAYSPELAGTVQGEASVKHLLMMASGADPFFMDSTQDGANSKDFLALLGADLGLAEYIRKDGKRKTPAGTSFQYNGRDTSALALVVEGATGMKLHSWFHEAVWQKIRAEYNAHWRLAAKDGRPVAEAGMWIAPRDMARIGSYMLAILRNQESTCMKQFLQEAMQPSFKTWWDSKGYGYQLWIDSRGLPQAMGHGGQMLSIDPQKNKAIVVFATKSNWRGAERLFHTWLDQ